MLKMFSTAALIAVLAMSAGGCARKGSMMSQGNTTRLAYADDDGPRGDSKCDGTVKTLPSGRKACIEHITDKEFLHQPEFNRAGEKEKRCADKAAGELVEIRLGPGLIGNYRC